MPSILSARSVTAGLALSMAAAAAPAAEWRTAAALLDGGTQVGLLTVEWTTGTNIGPQTAADLWELSFRLQADAGYGIGGAATDLTRDVVAAGAALPLGGLSITLADIGFSYDFDDLALGGDGGFEIDTDLNALLEIGGASGTDYWLFASSAFAPVILARYIDGALDADAVFFEAEWTTVSLTNGPVGDVPLPAGLALLPAALAGLGLLRRRG